MKVSALKKVFENQTPQSTLIIPSRSHRRSVSTSFIAQETLEEHIQLVKSPRDILQLVGDSTAQQRYFGSADELQPPVQVVSTNNDTKKQILELEQTLLDVKTENKLLAAETEGYLERERTLSQTLSNIRDENEKLKQELLVKEKSANEHTQEAIQTLSALEEENKKLNEDIQMKDKTTVELQSTIERLLLELKQKDEQLENLRQQNTKLSTFSHTIQHLPEQDETSEECVTVRVKHAPNDSILSNESLDVLRESPVERTNENYYDEDTESSWGLDIDVNNELLENKAAIESDLDKIEDECENTVQQDVEKVDLMDIEKTPATDVSSFSDEFMQMLTDTTAITKSFLTLKDNEAEKLQKKLISANELKTICNDIPQYKVLRGQGIKVRLVLMEKRQTWNRSKFSNLVTDFGAATDTVDSIECCILVGPWCLEWSSSYSICVPRRVSSLQVLEYISDMCILGEVFGKTIEEVTEIIATRITKWNKEKVYSATQCNCTHFITDILLAIGLPHALNKTGSKLHGFLNAIRANGSAEISTELRDHNSISNIIAQNIEKNPDFTVTNFQEFQFLTVIDRIIQSKTKVPVVENNEEIDW